MVNPSSSHLLAFGTIMNQYASREEGIKLALGGILQIELADMLVLAEPYTSQVLRNVAKSIVKEHLKPELAHTFCGIVGDWAAHSRLRNLIAHARWTDGDRATSIKPMTVSTREGRANWLGTGSDEKDYTLAELEEAANSLARINLRTLQFLEGSGLKKLMDEKIDAARASKSDVSGSEGSTSTK